MRKLSVPSWCLYDFASTIFMMNIVSIGFIQWLEQVYGNGDARYSVISTIVYVLCILLYPIVGEICNRGKKISPLLVLTLCSVIPTCMIAFFQNLWAASIFFVLAYVAYHLALTFYNSLLDDIATPKEYGKISGFGVAARYSGTICGLLMLDFFIKGDKQALIPKMFQFLIIDPAGPGEKIYSNTFLPTGIIYLVFTLPLFFFVRAKPPKAETMKGSDQGVFRAVWTNFQRVSKDKDTLLLMISLLLGGVPVYAAIQYMPIIVQKLGNIQDEIPVLLLATAFSIVGGVGFGFLLRPLGNKKVFNTVMALWIICFIFGTFSGSPTHMWIVGAIAGIGMGGFWAAARILFLDMAPEGREGEYMSLFGIILVLCGIVTSVFWLLGLYIGKILNTTFLPQRISCALMVVLGILGMVVFAYVKFPEVKESE